jgi:hypothetical protein
LDNPYVAGTGIHGPKRFKLVDDKSDKRMKATFAFLVFFLLIAPKSRALLGGWMGDAQNWITVWAPLSYLIVALVVMAPIISILLMMRWPKPEEPENPLAKYKHEDVCE